MKGDAELIRQKKLPYRLSPAAAAVADVGSENQFNLLLRVVVCVFVEI